MERKKMQKKRKTDSQLISFGKKDGSCWKPVAVNRGSNTSLKGLFKTVADNFLEYFLFIIFMSPVAKRGHIVFALSVCWFAGLLVCWLDNFNIGHNFWTVWDSAFVFGM